MTTFITIAEAAEILKVKEATFRTWIRRQLLPNEMFLKIGATVRIKVNIFNAFLLGDTEFATITLENKMKDNIDDCI